MLQACASVTAEAALDGNWMFASGEPAFLYLFMEAGLGWEFSPGTRLAFSVTNKGMNLDATFPGAFLQYKKPWFQFSFDWCIPPMRL
jgi:hypothetical protein